MAEIGDLVRHDNMAVYIDGGLDVVADKARSLAVRRHGPRIWICQRDLTVWRGLDLIGHRLKGAHLPAEGLDPLLQARRAHLGHIVLLPVRRVELGKIVRDALLDVFDAPQDRTGR